MRKKIALGLAVAMAASVGTTAFAASANPFTDVPTKHWSYNAIQQLAKAGIVDGFNDGQYKGDRAITRYEMAVMVAKAMAKEDKATASQQAIIDKLAAEYSQELANLGVRVKGLEDQVNTLQAKQSNIKFDGYARFRAENTPNTSNGQVKDNTDRTRVRINMTAPLDTDWVFKARMEYNNQDSTDNNASNTSAKYKTNFAQAYVQGKAFGLDLIQVGRVPLWLGQGMIADLKGDDNSSSPDAIVIGKTFGVVKLAIGGGTNNYAITAPNYAAANIPTNYNIKFASLTAPITDTLAFDASYLQDANKTFYKTVAGGLVYTGLENFTISGEYGQNKGHNISALTNGNESTAKAYFTQIKYKGADKSQVNSWGTWVAYNKIDTGFDPAGFKTLDMTNIQGAAFKATGLKGTEFGVEYTAFKNGILSFKYENYKTNSSYTNNDFNTAKKGYIGQLEVWF